MVGPETTIQYDCPEIALDEEERRGMTAEAGLAWDDVSGAELDPQMVHRARLKELEYIDKMGVWTIIDRGTAEAEGWPVSKK